MYRLFERREVKISIGQARRGGHDSLGSFQFSFDGMDDGNYQFTTKGMNALKKDDPEVLSGISDDKLPTSRPKQNNFEDENQQASEDVLADATEQPGEIISGTNQDLSRILNILYQKVKDNNNTSTEINEEITLTSEQFRFYFEKRCITPVKWRHMAGDVAWGNAAWMLGDSVGQSFLPDIYSTQAVASISWATLFWPLAIGVIVMAKYYKDAIQNFEREYHRAPTSEELSRINTDALALGCKVFGTVAGAELAKVLALQVLNAIGQAAISANGVLNPLGHLIMAGLVGLCAGLLVFGVTLIHEYAKEYRDGHKTIWANASKLFLAATLAGTAWYGISMIPGLGSIILGANGDVAGKGILDALTAVAKSIITYLTIKLTFFDLYKATKPAGRYDYTYSWQGDADPHKYMLTANFACLRCLEKEKKVESPEYSESVATSLPSSSQ